MPKTSAVVYLPIPEHWKGRPTKPDIARIFDLCHRHNITLQLNQTNSGVMIDTVSNETAPVLVLNELSRATPELLRLLLRFPERTFLPNPKMIGAHDNWKAVDKDIAPSRT